MTAALPQPVHALASFLVRLAASRWATTVRDEMRREWAAELHVLAHEPGSVLVRSGRALRFGASLACARPGDPSPFDALTPRSGPMTRTTMAKTAAVLLLVPVALAIVQNVAETAYYSPTVFSSVHHAEGRFVGETGAGRAVWADAGLYLATVGLPVVLAVLAGRLLGRRTAGAVPPVAAALLAVGCIGTGMTALVAATAVTSGGAYINITPGLFLVTWLVVLGGVAVGTARLAAGVGTGVAALRAVLAGLSLGPFVLAAVLTRGEVGSLTALLDLWQPALRNGPPGVYWTYVGYSLPYLACTVFVLAFVLAAARHTAAAEERVPEPAPVGSPA